MSLVFQLQLLLAACSSAGTDQLLTSDINPSVVTRTFYIIFFWVSRVTDGGVGVGLCVHACVCMCAEATL